MMNLGPANAVVGLEEEFDVEGGVVLAWCGFLGWKLCEFTRLPGYVLGGYPSHGCQDRSDFFRGASRQIFVREDPSVPKTLFESRPHAVDLPKVVAGPPCAAGLGVTALRHLVLLLWPVRPPTGGQGERQSPTLLTGPPERSAAAAVHAPLLSTRVPVMCKPSGHGIGGGGGGQNGASSS